MRANFRAAGTLRVEITRRGKWRDWHPGFVPTRCTPWSQASLAAKLQILGMEEATRGKISKIESRLVWGSNQNLVHFSRSSEQLIRGIHHFLPESDAAESGIC